MDPEIQQSLNNLEDLSSDKNRYLNDKLNVIALMDPEMQSLNMELCTYRNNRKSNGSFEINGSLVNGRCFNGGCYSRNGSPNGRLKQDGVSMDPENLVQENLLGRKCKNRHLINKIPNDLFSASNTTLTSLNLEDKDSIKNIPDITNEETDYRFSDSKRQWNSSIPDLYEFGLEMQNLQPKHICPHKTNKCPQIEDIEIFHKQTLKINKRNETNKRHHHHRNKPNTPKIPKSSTLSSITQTKKEDEFNTNECDKLPVTPIHTERSNSFSCLRIDSATEPSSTVLVK